MTGAKLTKPRPRLTTAQRRRRDDARARALLTVGLPAMFGVLAGLLAYGATGAATDEAAAFLTGWAQGFAFIAVVVGALGVVVSGVES